MRTRRPSGRSLTGCVDEFEWDSDDYEMWEARREFKAAMVQQFNDLYGTDVDNLGSWQKLCHILNIEPVPQGLKKCRERVRATHVNLVNLVDTVMVFRTLADLQEYTIDNGLYFSKKDAYAGGLLRFLLREIHHTYAGKSKNRANKGCGL